MSRITAAVFLAALAGTISAAHPAIAGKFVRAGKYNPDHRTVDVFKARTSGEVTVQLIMASSKKGALLLRNNTKEPLNIAVPMVFAGLPVEGKQREKLGAAEVELPQRFGGRAALAQLQPPGGPFNQAVIGNDTQDQAVGNGLPNNPGGNNPGPFAPGNPFNFNVGPGEATRIRLPAVCLEHGKDEPSPRVYYKLAPIQKTAKDPAVGELIAMLAQNEVNQRAAQAAVWHVTDRMTWQQLARKKAKHLDGSVSPYFTRPQLRDAVKAVKVARHRAQQRAKQSTSGSDK